MGTATIHPLGIAYLEVKDKLHAAYDLYIDAVKAQFGPKANAFTHSKKEYNAQTAKAQSDFHALQHGYVDALAAMRRANATVHPINK